MIILENLIQKNRGDRIRTSAQSAIRAVFMHFAYFVGKIVGKTSLRDIVNLICTGATLTFVNSNFQPLNIQLSCAYGTINLQRIYKCGKLITINLNLSITTEIPANTAFISGLPVCAVTYLGCARALHHDNGASIDIYIGNATINTAATNSMPVGIYGINISYITN